MKRDILLVTNNKQITDNFRKVISRDRFRLDIVNTPAQLERVFRKSGEIVHMMILDLRFSRIILNRMMFHIRQYRRELPVFLLHRDRFVIQESEALRNLSVYGCVKPKLTKEYFKEILDNLDNLTDPDMDKKLGKVEYLEQENVFACTFKNMKTYFLSRKDIPGDDDTRVKRLAIDKDKYYFTVYLESGKECVVVWDFIRAMCDEEYKYYKGKITERISSEEIGKRICQTRKLRRLTQESLAAKTGIRRANISRIEKGKHYPSLETLEKIAEALEVPVARFLAR